MVVVHIILESGVDYLLIGAALFPAYMRLDEHTFAHVIETTGELVTLLACWIVFWPAIGFFVLRNRVSAHLGGGANARQKLQIR